MRKLSFPYIPTCSTLAVAALGSAITIGAAQAESVVAPVTNNAPVTSTQVDGVTGTRPERTNQSGNQDQSRTPLPSVTSNATGRLNSTTERAGSISRSGEARSTQRRDDDANRTGNFAGLDANGDGRISRNEANSNAEIRRSFRERDTNKDGFLSSEEHSVEARVSVKSGSNSSDSNDTDRQ